MIGNLHGSYFVLASVIYCGPVTPYGVICLRQAWFMYWFAACMVPSHHLDWWSYFNWSLTNKLQCNLNPSTSFVWRCCSKNTTCKSQPFCCDLNVSYLSMPIAGGFLPRDGPAHRELLNVHAAGRWYRQWIRGGRRWGSVTSGGATSLFSAWCDHCMHSSW